MASHVTFTPSAGVNTAKGIGAQAGAESQAEGGMMGVFAAMLGAANQATTAATSETAVDLSLGKLVNLSFGAGFGGAGGEETEDPEAIAAVVDTALPIQVPFDAKPVLADLVDSLAELKLGLEAGDTIDPELLKRIDAALEGLAAEFDTDLSTLHSLDDLKALTTAILPDATDVAARLTAALAPLAETFLSGSATTDASADIDTAIKSIGEKLMALLQSLDAGGIDPEQLAALGLDPDAGTDADLEAAIARLLGPPAKVDASANAKSLHRRSSSSPNRY